MTINTINNNVYFTNSLSEGYVHSLIQELEKVQDNCNLFFNTSGGSVYAGLALYDYLCYRVLNKPVNVIGVGRVFSAGTYALFTPNNTFFYPNCSTLFHPASTSLKDDSATNTIKSCSDQMLYFETLAVEIYASKNFTDSSWKDKDVYYTSKQLVEIGVGRLWSNPVITIKSD